MTPCTSPPGEGSARNPVPVAFLFIYRPRNVVREYLMLKRAVFTYDSDKETLIVTSDIDQDCPLGDDACEGWWYSR